MALFNLKCDEQDTSIQWFHHDIEGPLEPLQKCVVTTPLAATFAMNAPHAVNCTSSKYFTRQLGLLSFLTTACQAVHVSC